MRTDLLRNVRFNFFAFVAGKAAAAVVGIAVPRLLGPEKMGQYVSAWGLAAFVSVVADLGLAAYVTREASRSREDPGAVGALFYRADDFFDLCLRNHTRPEDSRRRAGQRNYCALDSHRRRPAIAINGTEKRGTY